MKCIIIHVICLNTGFLFFRVNDAENLVMTEHIITFVKGWNSNYSDPSLLNGE